MKDLIIILLGSATPVLACTNTLLYPIKKYQRLVIYLYVLFIYFFLSQKVGQWITPLVIVGMMGLITLFQKKNRTLNIAGAFFGYFCAVVLNHCFTVILSLFGFSISEIHANTVYAITFNITFTLSAVILTYIVGRKLRKKWKENDTELSIKIKYLIMLETCACFLSIMFNMIFGENIGYTPKIITINGILFLSFFIVTSIVIFQIISEYEKVMKNKEKVIELENVQKYADKVIDQVDGFRNFDEEYYKMLSDIHSYITNNDIDSLKLYDNKFILKKLKRMKDKAK